MTDGSLFNLSGLEQAPPTQQSGDAGSLGQSQSLYRKYRPQTFAEDDLFGQEHVVNTLRNAIALNRIAHAYLFCGPRGTGKTTVLEALRFALDRMPNATMDQKVATGFNRCHLLNGEGGAIPEEQRNVILFDRVDVTATTWLATTMACAQCHNHKYDPITQRDYYSFMAFFNNVPESGTPSGGGQYRIADPAIVVPTDEDTAKIKGLEARIAEAKAEAEHQDGPGNARERSVIRGHASAVRPPENPAESPDGEADGNSERGRQECPD